ncbi:Wall-associated receptor kinase-like 14 [Capsicum baccatum]|uniref:Wall-associated receptor kinase-like 14 n=1 Tax=Capsicum baccatum TaxID=33114 RepID=A0A2G2XIN2_CAPBA|nr:Wall-associated receptor kinase-like 14 [Capsicum baccatum]
MVENQIITIRLVFSILLIWSTSASAVETNQTSKCNQYCGAGSNALRVHYPFGFSEGCRIRLNCTESTREIRIGEFTVQNMTSDTLMVNFPVNCSRPIEDLQQFDGNNYAITWRNGLLLQNCKVPRSECTIPSELLSTRLNIPSCDSKKENVSCYSEARADYMEYTKLRDTGCAVVVSSILVGMDNDTKKSSSMFLEFQTLELAWGLEGDCACDDDADCTNVLLTGNRTGFRCRCKDGFIGDGFRGGDGCRRVSRCNPSRYLSGRCGGTTRIGVLVGVGIFAGAGLMAALAILCCCMRRRSASLKKRMSAKRLLSEAAGGNSVPLFQYKEIERATNSFSEKQRLGIGAYGTVYAGKLHSDEWVAIKKLRHRDPDGVEQVMNEIKLLSSVSHPNLVRLLGCCIENGEQILVYEFMPNGTLAQHLQRERGSGLPWTIRLTIATETAHAIAHLHSAMNPPIYHRDIKSSNILLDYNFNSKVADFGLSRFGMMDDSHISTAPQGTPGYVDPQYHQNYHLSDKSDVYSFGVVLVEIITALKVVDFSRAHSEINLAALAIDRIGKGRVDEIIDPFLEPHRDAWTLSSVHRVAELAFRCLAFHRDMRPSMTEVADELEQIRLSSWASLEDNVCMTSSVNSSCSSPRSLSETSFRSTTTKKGVGSRRLIVPQKMANSLTPMEEIKDSSPVSVQDPWLSEESPPSTNRLLGNAGR